MKRLVLVFVACCSLFFSAFQSLAQIPRTLSYQGVLTDATGKPRPEGNYTFIFRLYNIASGGTAIWSESKTLLVKGGLFSTVLGDQTPFGANVKFDRPYWLGIQAGNEPELAPRISLTSVGYSMNSLRADTAMVAMATSADTTWRHKGSDIYRLQGNVGIGRMSSSRKLHVVGGNAQIENLPGQPTALTIGNDSTGSTYLGITTSAYGSGYVGLQGVSSEGSAWGAIALNARGGGVGIGLTNPIVPLALAVTNKTGAESPLIIGQIDVYPMAGVHHVREDDYHGYSGLTFKTTTGNSYTEKMRITYDGRVGIGTINPTAKLDVAGRTKTCVLEITGGCDLAEPFEMAHPEPLPAGALVVIDPDNPGKLKQATEPYDKRVAGVISGAGGINPGLTLRQEGVMEAGQLVALTGKVYALATAANGPIKPGDRLTTSTISGHCMKATDSSLCDGAVIGKAMSSLETGEGLVLVLVNLQ